MRPQWVPDCQAKRCHCCSKEFIIIVRNKHHCRFCGNVVCAGCSSQSISGEQISYSEEKKLRICDGCYEKVKKMLKKSLMKSVIQNIVDGA